MSKKEEYQGPIINSLQGELKPVDYSLIEPLRKKAGVSKEYLKKCKEIHRKKSMEELQWAKKKNIKGL